MNAQDQTADLSVWGVSKTDSVSCWENYNNFGALANQKQYVQAYEHWNLVYETCPTAYKNVYIYGPRVVEAMIDDTKAKLDAAAEADKAALQAEYDGLVAQLLGVYDARLEHFPGKEAYVLASKAQDMYSYRGDESAEEVFEIFNKAMDIDPTELSAVHFWTYFRVAVALKKADKLDLAGVFDTYNNIGENIGANTDALNIEIAKLTTARDSGTIDDKGLRTLDRDEKLLENYEKVQGNVEKSLRSMLTNCDVIAKVYNAETFAEHKEDEVWIRRAVRTLGAEYKTDSGTVITCRDNPLYFELTEALYQMNPSTEAARNMGRLALVRSEWAKAVDYFGQAAAGEVDPVKKAEDYLKKAYAETKLGRLADAKQSCVLGARADVNNGQIYLQWAAVYAQAGANGSCGADTFEKRAAYWAAMDKARRAAQIDASLASNSAAAVRAYSKGIPDKTVSFQLGHKEGDTHTIGCWINETVTARW